MQHILVNLAVLSTTTMACMTNGQVKDFHDQVHNEVQNTLLNLREQNDATVERLGEWHEIRQKKFDVDVTERKVEMDESMESGKPDFSDFPEGLNPKETHDSLSESESDSSDVDSSFHNDPFFKNDNSFFNHPLSSLNSLIGSFFNDMGAFFGGSGMGTELVKTENITTENGTDYRFV